MHADIKVESSQKRFVLSPSCDVLDLLHKLFSEREPVRVTGTSAKDDGRLAIEHPESINDLELTGLRDFCGPKRGRKSNIPQSSGSMLDKNGVGRMFGNVTQEPLDLVALARDFVGKWVALHPETRDVVAAGESAKAVLKEAEGAGVLQPLILQVSDDYGGLAPWLA